MDNCAPARVGSRLASMSKQKVSESAIMLVASPMRSRTPLTRAALHSAARVPTTSTMLSAMASSCIASFDPYRKSDRDAHREGDRKGTPLHCHHLVIALDIG